MLDRILADMLMKALYCIVGRNESGHCERYHIVAILDAVIKCYKDKIYNHQPITKTSYNIFKICRDDLGKQGF